MIGYISYNSHPSNLCISSDFLLPIGQILKWLSGFIYPSLFISFHTEPASCSYLNYSLPSLFALFHFWSSFKGEEITWPKAHVQKRKFLSRKYTFVTRIWIPTGLWTGSEATLRDMRSWSIKPKRSGPRPFSLHSKHCKCWLIEVVSA